MMPRPPCSLVVGALACVVLSSGCQEPPFAHVNINDPLGPEIAATLEGVPDTIRRYGERFTARIATDPPLPENSAKVFVSMSPEILVPFDGGVFEGRRFSAAPLSIDVAARIGPIVMQKTVIVYSAPDSLEVVGCNASSVCGPITSLNSGVTLRAVGRFLRQFILFDIEYALENRGGIVVRDPAVLFPAQRSSGSTYIVRARANGESWVVFTADQVQDSVLVRVSQVVDRWTLRCPTGLRVGDVGRISATDPVDLGGSPVPGVGPVEWLPADRTAWTGDATIELGGEVTALAAGTIYVQGNVPSLGNREWGFCTIQIQP